MIPFGPFSAIEDRVEGVHIGKANSPGRKWLHIREYGVTISKGLMALCTHCQRCGNRMLAYLRSVL